MNFQNKRVTIDLAEDLQKFADRIEFDWIYYKDKDSYSYRCYDSLVDELPHSDWLIAPTYKQVIDFLTNNRRFVNFTVVNLIGEETAWKNSANKMIRIHLASIK